MQHYGDLVQIPSYSINEGMTVEEARFVTTLFNQNRDTKDQIKFVFNCCWKDIELKGVCGFSISTNKQKCQRGTLSKI